MKKNEKRGKLEKKKKESNFGKNRKINKKKEGKLEKRKSEKREKGMHS